MLKLSITALLVALTLSQALAETAPRTKVVRQSNATSIERLRNSLGSVSPRAFVEETTPNRSTVVVLADVSKKARGWSAVMVVKLKDSGGSDLGKTVLGVAAAACQPDGLFAAGPIGIDTAFDNISAVQIDESTIRVRGRPFACKNSR